MRRLLALVAALLITPSVAGAQTIPPDQRFPPPMLKPPLVSLTRHVFVLPDPEVILVPTVGVIVGSKGTLVIDTGMGRINGETVVREVRRVSRTSRWYFVATHTHAEHLSGIGALPAGTTFIASRPQAGELAKMTGPAPFAGVGRLAPVIADLVKDATLRPPDLVFDGAYRLDLGGVTVRLLDLGTAHSVGDTVIEVEGTGIVFSGDIGNTRRFPSFTPQSTGASWLAVLDRIEALKPRILIPCHGAFGDRTTLAQERRMLLAIRERVRALKAEGRTRDETAAAVDREFQARYPDWKATLPNQLPPIAQRLFDE